MGFDMLLRRFRDAPPEGIATWLTVFDTHMRIPVSFGELMSSYELSLLEESRWSRHKRFNSLLSLIKTNGDLDFVSICSISLHLPGQLLLQ